MLTVPEGEGGAKSFNPGDWGHRHQALRKPPRGIAVPGGEGGAVEARGAILSGADYQLRGMEQRGERESDPLVAAEAARQRDFDGASLRNDMTGLHERADAFTAGLEGAPGREIPGLMRKTETFLRDERAKFTAEATTDGQRREGESFFDAFADQRLAQAQRIVEAKTATFEAEVADRQKRAFLREALRPGNLFDDRAVWNSVDMALRGASTALERLPEAERAESARRLARDIVGPVMDERLNQDPARLRSLLDNPDVEKVMGREAVAGYAEKAALAERDDALRSEAKGLAVSGIDREAAEQKIHGLYPDAGDRGAVREHYEHYRYNANRDAVLALDSGMRAAWGAVEADGVRRGTIPVEVRRNNPELNAFLERSIERVQANGGLSPTPDYARLLDAATGFKPREAAEAMRDGNAYYGLVEKLGGPGSPAAGMYMRMFSGQATPEDKALLDDIGTARSVAERLAGGGVAADVMSRFLADFEVARTEAMRRGKHARLLGPEGRTLAAEVWGDGTAYGGKNV